MTVRKARTDIDVFELECLKELSCRCNANYLNSIVLKAQELLIKSPFLFKENYEGIEFKDLEKRKKFFANRL